MKSTHYYIVTDIRNGEIVFRDGLQDFKQQVSSKIFSDAMSDLIIKALGARGKYNLFEIKVDSNSVKVIRKRVVNYRRTKDSAKLPN